MVKTLNFISANGAEMPLLINRYFTLIGVDGFTQVQSSLASIVVPFVDGDTLTNIQAQPRSVVLYLRIKDTAGVEAAKRYIMQYVKPKLAGTIRLEQDDRNIQLAGIVEAVEMPRFGQGCTMAITLHCSQPYWQDVDYLVNGIAEILNLHYFPLPENGLAFPADGVPFGAYDDDLTQEISNNGDVETGMVITITASGAARNPKLYNTLTGEYIGVNVSMHSADEIVISMIKGQKTITKNGVNIIDKIMQGSTFLQLATGLNEFTIQADSGIDNIYYELMYKQLYV